MDNGVIARSGMADTSEVATSPGMGEGQPHPTPLSRTEQPLHSPRTNASHTASRSIAELRNPPPHLAAMRQRLFEIKEPIELQVHEFNRYWPYIDNVWVRQHKAGTDKTGKYVTDYYACRLQRPTYTPKPDAQKKEGAPSRKKQRREGGTCQMRLKTIRYIGGYSRYAIMRIGDDAEHTHDLCHIDKIKRTSVLMDIARSEVMKGYMPASVFTVMNQDYQKLCDAGGKYLNRNDVRNASQHWRQEHKEGLRVHQGYKYDYGNGIVRQIEGMGRGLDGAIGGEAEVFDPALSNISVMPQDTLRLSDHFKEQLEPYLPPKNMQLPESGCPFVTLTYATSLDSSLTLAPGMQTHLSGLESKAMTHFLRSRHDAILVGVGTAIADDPALNCRLEGVGGYGGLGWEGQPRPVVIDPNARWAVSAQSKTMQVASQGRGRAPWVIMTPGFAVDATRLELLKSYGGKYLGLSQFDTRYHLRWEAILKALAAEGINSVMIEGGGMVINDMLQRENAGFINSVIVTIAPTYLGHGGVGVSPAPRLDHTGRPSPVTRLGDVRWLPMGEDAVMCGKMPVAVPASIVPHEPMGQQQGALAETHIAQMAARGGEHYSTMAP